MKRLVLLAIMLLIIVFIMAIPAMAGEISAVKSSMHNTYLI